MNKEKSPVLIILVGPPGSGKTYLSEKLFKDRGFVHINSDSVRAQYFTNLQFTTEERIRVYQKIKEVITATLLAGSNVIFDGNLLTNTDRKEAYDYYTKDIGANVLFVCLDIPRDIAIKQAIARESTGDNLYNKMPAERAIRMHDTFQDIDESLPHIKITNLDDVSTIESEIDSLL